MVIFFNICVFPYFNEKKNFYNLQSVLWLLNVAKVGKITFS